MPHTEVPYTSYKTLFEVVFENSLNPLNTCLRLVYVKNGKPKEQIKILSEITAQIERDGIRTQPFLVLNLCPQTLLSGEEEEKEGRSVPLCLCGSENAYLLLIMGWRAHIILHRYYVI